METGRTTEAFVGLQDHMPTICDLVGAETPETDSKNFVSLFAETSKESRDAMFAEFHGEPKILYAKRTIRTDRYKLVYNGPDVIEPYDFAAAPTNSRIRRPTLNMKIFAAILSIY